jgi:hypothetical protein
MADYANGKIYRLVCNVTGLQYIGSTVSPLSVRLTGHTQGYKRYQKGTTNFVTSYKILESGNFAIDLIEDYPCKENKELLTRERYYIEKLDCVNKIIPSRTHQEWYEAHKVEIREQKKTYRETRRDAQNNMVETWLKKNFEIVTDVTHKLKKGDLLEMYNRDTQDTMDSSLFSKKVRSITGMPSNARHYLGLECRPR